MPSYRYLIVGGGMSAAAAAEAVRDTDPDGEIGLVGVEDVAPYDRPPLSKGLWFGKDPTEVFRALPDDGLTLHLGRRVADIDLEQHVAIDERGERYGYERLLLATGSRPRTIAGVEAGGSVVYYRTLADYRHVRARAGEGTRVCVIGSGFIGQEMAAGLRSAGCEVTYAFPHDAVGSQRFPPGLARSLSNLYREHGVEVAPQRRLTSTARRGERLELRFDDGSNGEADLVVIGVGVEPNDGVAARAGLPVRDGIVVDEMLRAGRADVFACGDVARFRQPDLGLELRIEHEDNALSMGRHAGRAMAGRLEPYRHLPFFYSDLFDQGYEAVGRIDASLATVEDWREENREGVVYYLDGDRVRGVLLWNVFGKVDDARALIGLDEPVTAEGLRGRIGP